MESTVNQRIRELYFLEKKRGNTLFKLLDLPQSTVHALIRDEGKSKNQSSPRKPTFKVLKALFNHYPNLNHRWLLFGEGEMFLYEMGEEEKSYEPVDNLSIIKESKVLKEKQKLLDDVMLKQAKLIFQFQEENIELKNKIEELEEKLQSK